MVISGLAWNENYRPVTRQRNSDYISCQPSESHYIKKYMNTDALFATNITRRKSLRHFIAYHNAKMMKYSCTDIPEPRVQIRKPVEGLEGVALWLVAGEGESPKSYFLAAAFVASRCEPGSFPAPNFPISSRARGLSLASLYLWREPSCLNSYAKNQPTSFAAFTKRRIAR